MDRLVDIEFAIYSPDRVEKKERRKKNDQDQCYKYNEELAVYLIKTAVYPVPATMDSHRIALFLFFIFDVILNVHNQNILLDEVNGSYLCFQNLFFGKNSEKKFFFVILSM